MGLPVEVNPLFLENQYPIQRSLRFRSSASAYLNRTPASTTNTTTWTWSGWVKRGALGASKLFGSATATSNTWYLMYGDNIADALTFGFFNGTNAVQVTTTALYRDPSSWYHVVLAVDTTQATAANRAKIYVNGVQAAITTATYPTLSQTTLVNSNTAIHYIGLVSPPTTGSMDGYLSEVNFIDGLSFFSDTSGTANPNFNINSFGQYNEFGVWSPRKYGGSYGTNGFYLPFNDPTSATTLCYDRQLGYTDTSKNNWTPNNISTTAGVTYDAMTDVPPPSTIQNVAAGNYAVMNPLSSTSATISNGNLSVALSASGGSAGTIAGFISGKWYYEAVITAGATNSVWLGWLSDAYTKNDNAWAFSTQTALYGSLTGNNGNNAAYGATYSTNDVIGVAIDLSTSSGSITFYKNGVSQGVMFSSLTTSAVWRPFFSGGSGGQTVAFNFGQRPFSYTPPSGFRPLNSNNLPMPTIPNGARFMAATKYDGTSSSNNVSNATNNTLGTTFQPDFVWIKNRNYAPGTNHVLIDSIRGASLGLASNLTNADFSTTGNFSSINNNGFTVAGTTRDYNFLNDTFVGWQWNAGSGSSTIPSGGSITPTGASINVSAGFSIIKYTGTGVAGTLPHGLGAAPSMVITKKTSTAGDEWVIWHTSLSGGNFILLFTTAAQFASTQYTAIPTSLYLNLNTATAVNNNVSSYISYIWTPIAGYSAFGSYTGNGSADGPFVYTGFRPRWVMIKATTNISGNWVIIDTSRLTYNQNGTALYANVANSEVTTVYIDTLSNGFKIRNNSTNLNNSASDTYVYACFAENPFKLALAR